MKKRLNTETDEFGRKRVEKKSFVNNKKQQPREWPPCFETNGHSYVFDNRSGMFYEGESDFFYDPKSKLYYGNKKLAYFRYNPDNITNHFEELENSNNSDEHGKKTTSDDLNLEPVLLTGTKDTVDNKTKIGSISITLKTKTLKSNKLKKEKIDTQVVAVPKQHAADIEKWTERQVEIRNEKKDVAEAVVDEAIVTPEASVEAKKIETTEKGEPICLLCRRKFPTIAKLRYHEKASTLHQENLAKAEAALKSDTGNLAKNEAAMKSEVQVNAETSTDVKPVYVDRAKQRRLLHGPETIPAKIVDFPVAGSTELPEQESHQPIAKEKALGESNIGNQMLQKLGWKQGSSLGSDSTNPAESRSGSDPSAATQLLANEWARIESIAASNERNNKR